MLGEEEAGEGVMVERRNEKQGLMGGKNTSSAASNRSGRKGVRPRFSGW